MKKVMDMKFVCGYAWIFRDLSIGTIGTGFTDNKDTSRTIRTGFTDRIVVSHDTWELTERRFLMGESLYKGALALAFAHTLSAARCEYINFGNFTAYTVYV